MPFRCKSDIVTEHSKKPRKVICCVGSKTDLFGCTVSPKEFITFTESLILCLQCSYVEPCKHESSIYAGLVSF